MKWSRIKLILRREIKDQLRDRRTIFMVFGLPILLYPILGLSMIQLTAGQRPKTVVLVGAHRLLNEPGLLAEGSDDQTEFHPEFRQGSSSVLDLRIAEPNDGWEKSDRQLSALQNDQVDAIMIIPPDLRDQIEALEQPKVQIVYLPTDDGSLQAYRRLSAILDRWKDAIVADRLLKDQKTESYTDPLLVEAINAAAESGANSARGGSLWARLFPFLLVMMSMTGAFYPAIDLCAGEKERGTMETLLITPSLRSEIVIGKFLTVMAASVATALLNLASMGLTMGVIAGQFTESIGSGALDPNQTIDQFRPPSMGALAWSVVLVIPLSGFFSAICLTLAVLARSMKEGQYYMTPLYLVALPLVFLTLMPGVELNPLFSLLPVTGVSLLLKDLMLEQYAQVRPYFVPVIISTLAYAGIALRWAVKQFRTEDVLFRESERFDPVAWCRYQINARGPVPSAGQSILCFLLIIALSWYTSFLVTRPGINTVTSLLLGQLLFILGPTLVMTWFLTSDRRRTLGLRWPGTGTLLLGGLLAVLLHPLVFEFRWVIEHFFPTPESIKTLQKTLGAEVPNPVVAVLIFALLPAVTEELAFRGYILSGLRPGDRAGAAILLSAILFGLLHVLLSISTQFFNACALGVVLGLLAVRSKSVLPGILFHFFNNALAILVPSALAGLIASDSVGAVSWLYRDPEALRYHWPWLVLGTLSSIVLLSAYCRLGAQPRSIPLPGAPPRFSESGSPLSSDQSRAFCPTPAPHSSPIANRHEVESTDLAGPLHLSG